MFKSLSNDSTRGLSTLSEFIFIPPMAISDTLIVIYFLSFLGSLRVSLTFNGKDVTSFLKKYESICDIYQIQTLIRLKKVSEYYENNIIKEIEAFTT
jgi:hypothetical protein